MDNIFDKNQPPKMTRWLQYLVVCLGILICVQSGLSLYGWRTYHANLINVFPFFLVMGYKIAICFYLTGISVVILTLSKKFSYFSFVTSLFVVIATSYAALEGIISLAFPLSKIIFTHFTMEADLAQLSPNSALNFMLANIALIMMNVGRPRRYNVIWGNFLGLLVFIAGGLLIVGYATGIEAVYKQYAVSSVGLNSAVLFILIGLCVIFSAWYKSVAQKVDIIRALPFNVFICFTLGTLSYWYTLRMLSYQTNTYTNVPEILFVVGLIVTLLITFTLHFAIDAHVLAKKRAEALAVLNATLESTPDGVLSVDTRGRILNFNQKFLEMWGMNDSSLVLTHKDILNDLAGFAKAPDLFVKKVDDLHHYPNSDSFYELELQDGKIFECYSQPQLLKKEVIGRVWCFRDVSENKAMQAQILHQTTHSLLTNLPNRLLLTDRLTQSINAAERENKVVAVVLLDIDKFKLVNDSLGHDKGDLLLNELSERLGGVIQKEDTLAHFSGDMFAVVISNLDQIESCIPFILQCQKAIIKPFKIGEYSVPITCSLGISVFPKDGKEADTLIKNADAAMQTVKTHGGGNFQFFTDAISLLINDRMTFGNEMRDAINRHEFFLMYQPIFNLKTGEVDAAECLLRWQHPKEGLVPPDKFIHLAEENGLIELLSEYVLRQAAKTVHEFKTAGLRDIRFCVNLSSPQMNHYQFGFVINEVLKEFNIESHLLEIELTENILLESTRTAVDKMFELTNLGISLSIDDFGTGYSNLRYLQDFPFSALKIDQFFVKQILDNNKKDAAIVVAIITIARALRLRVIAEGIEKKEQLDFLVKHGCDEGQGFYLSRPIPKEKLFELIKQNHNVLT